MVFNPDQSLLVWIESIQKFFEFGPLITKVRHNLAHMALQEKALNSILHLLLPCLSSLLTFSYSALFHYAPSPTALIFIPHISHKVLIFIPRILLQSLLSLIECSHELRDCSPFSFHRKALNTSLISPTPSSMGAWYNFPPASALIPPTLALPPPSLTVTQPTSLWREGVVPPPPDHNLSPLPSTTLLVGLKVWVWEMRTVCVCGGRGLEIKPTLYKWQFIQKQRGGWFHTCCLILRLLQWRLFSFRTFSYNAYHHSAPYPTVLNFTMLLLL